MSDVIKLSDSPVALPQEIAQIVTAKAAETSLVGRLGTQTSMPLSGKAFPYYEGGIEAGIVEEGGVKPVSKPTTSLKYVVPKKVATIVIVSDEMVRNDPAGMLAKIQEDMGNSIGRALDQLVLHGRDALSGAPVAGQTGLFDAVTNTVELTEDDYKAAILAGFDLVGSEHDVTATAWDASVRGKILQTAQDVQFGLPDLAASSVLVAGVPAVFARSIGRNANGDSGVRGVIGDFSKLVYGFSNNITYKRSDQATVVTSDGETLHLWQRNLQAILVEAEFGGVVLEEKAFATITDSVEG